MVKPKEQKKEPTLKEISAKLDEILTKLEEHFANAPAADDADSAGSDDDGDTAEGDGEVKLPDSIDEINELDKEAAAALCDKLGIDTEGMKHSAMKQHLVTVVAIIKDETDDIDDEDITSLADAVGVKAGKKISQTVAALKEAFGEASSSTEEDSDDDDKDSKDADDDDDDAKKSDDDDDDDAKDGGDDDDAGDAEGEDDGVDRAKVAKKAPLPKEAIMRKRLDAFNEAADEDDQINVKKLGVPSAYRKLLERLVTSESEIAPWGEPYIASGEYVCCGLSLAETKVKGVKLPCGKCLVTEKVFSIDEESNFSEIEN